MVRSGWLLAGASAVAFGGVALAGTAAGVIDSTIFRDDNGTPGVFADDFASVDYLRFSVLSDGIVTIDFLSWEQVGESGKTVDVNSDGEIAFIDTHALLFFDNAVLAARDFITGNDDAGKGEGEEDGSIDIRDSFLSLFLEIGDYLMAVSSFDLTIDEAVEGVNALMGADGPSTVAQRGSDRVPNDHGDYRATFFGDLSVKGAPIPLPTAVGLGGLALAGGGGFWGVVRRRRRLVSFS